MLRHEASTWNSFGSTLARAARRWRRAVDLELRPHALTEATWLPLLHVARAAAPMRQKDLAAALGLDSSAVVRLLDSLEAADLVVRREGDGDRRSKVIVLTPAGRETVERVEGVGRRVREHALAGLSAQDLHTAHWVLEHVCGALSAGPGETVAGETVE